MRFNKFTILPAVLFFTFYTATSYSNESWQNNLGMTFIQVPAGEFQMGTSRADAEIIAQEMEKPDASKFKDEMPRHRVLIKNGFWLQRTEVTQEQWFRVMENKPGPEEYWQHKDWRELPVVSVSWDMAIRYIEELNKMDKTTSYRLPTEAEWEYAARAGAGTVRPYPVSQLNDYAWFIRSSDDVPHPVATRKPNAWGLYDTLGNVWEWVSDNYAPGTYEEGQYIDPVGPEQGRSRVRRGGSYHCPLYQTRPGYRSANSADTAYSVIGFRVVAQRK
jgi:formylglycine-generating enzyme required for sulfatase activity